jgi:predicted nuclease of predicted toxin-antitoxin system
LKFLIDMPLSPSLATWLSQQGHDAVHATDLGLHTAADTDIIARVVVVGSTTRVTMQR